MHQLKTIIIYTAIALNLAACQEFAAGVKAPKPGQACSLAENQSSTLLAPVNELPIRLYLDPKFKSSQVDLIKAAIGAWNNFSVISIKQKMFEIVETRALVNFHGYFSGYDFCADTAITEGVYVVSEDSVSHWKQLGYSEATGGMTIRCSAGASPRMIMMLNSVELTEDLFVGAALHELGHVLGLDHSCNNRDKGDGTIVCERLGKSHPYRLAVMTGKTDFSSMSNGRQTWIIGTPLSGLQQNDLDRAYCLYGGHP